MLQLDELNFFVGLFGDVVVDELVLDKDLILKKIFAKSFFFLVGCALQFDKFFFESFFNL